MNDFNNSMFLLINAPAQPNLLLLWAAKFFAAYAIWLIPMCLVAGWLWGTERTRKLMLEAAASGLAGLLIAQIIGLLWFHPRPFAVGLGHQLIPHVPNASFPSDHLTLLWAVSFSLLSHPRTRLLGGVLALMGLPVAWARIFVGVHFPLDMVGAAAVAMVSAWLCLHCARYFVEPVFGRLSPLYRRVFAPLIRRGWVLA
jgi:undecaprenyl-diphosphatase